MCWVLGALLVLGLVGQTAAAAEKGAGGRGAPRVDSVAVVDREALSSPAPAKGVAGDVRAPSISMRSQPKGSANDPRHQALARAKKVREELIERPAPSPALPAEIEEGKEHVAQLRQAGELTKSYEPGTKEFAEKFGSQFAEEPGGTKGEPPAPGVTAPDSNSTHVEPAVARMSGLSSLTPQQVCGGNAYCSSYSSSLSMNPAPTFLGDGYERVSITNLGTTTWTPSNMYLSYHVFNSDNSVRQYIGWMTTLPSSVVPGHSIQMVARIGGLPAGSYKIVWDLRRANANGDWFSDSYGVPTSAQEPFTIPHYAPVGQYLAPSTYNATVDTLTPEFRAQVRHDRTRALAIEFKVCESGSTSCWQSGWQSVPLVDSFSTVGEWTIPSDRLYWNQQYDLNFRIRDGSSVGTWVDSIPFVPVVVQPDENKLGSDPRLLDEQSVNAFTGQFVQNAVDLSLPGALQDVSVPRTYNSGDATDHPFGTGWSSALDALWTQSTNAISIRLPDGKVRKYAENPDGTYAGGYGEPLNRSIFPSSRQISVGGIQYQFSMSSGRLEVVNFGPTRALRFDLDSQGRATDVWDVFSNRHIYLQWTGSHVTSMSSGLGQTGLVWKFTYSGAELSKVCDARGNTACQTYEYAGTPKQLIHTASPRGTNYAAVFYEQGRVQRVARPDGDWTYAATVATESTSQYGESLVVKIRDPRRTTKIGYNKYGAPLFESDNVYESQVSADHPYEEEIIYSYNYKGQLSSRQDQNNNITEYDYDPILGLVSGVRRYRPDPIATFYTYYRPDTFFPNDPKIGKLLRVRNANSKDVNYTYRSDGNLLSQTAARGSGDTATTTYGYSCDNGDEPVVVNDPGAPAGATQPCGLLAKVTDPGGQVTRYAYDRSGSATRVTTPTGHVTDTFYDAYGWPSSEKVSTSDEPGGATTTYTRDQVGNVLTTQGPLTTNAVTGLQQRHGTEKTYDIDGNLLSVKEGNRVSTGDPWTDERTTTYTYDNRNRQTSITQSGTVTSRTAYNAFGQPEETWDANDNHHVFEYWPRGQLRKEQLVNYVNPAWVSPAGQTRSIVLQSLWFDAGGRLKWSIDPMGHQTLFTWTADNLLDTEQRVITDASGGYVFTTVHDYDYDEVGNAVADTSRTSSGQTRRTTATYDDGNARRKVIVDPKSALNPNGLDRATTYSYNVAGDVTGSELSDGTRTEQVRIGYGADGQMTQRTVENGTTDLTTQYTVNAYGDVTAETDPRGSAPEGSTAAPDTAFTTLRTYDAQGQLKSVSAPATPTEDGTGQAATSQRAMTTVGHDVYGQVDAVRDPKGAETFSTRDELGRITQVTTSPTKSFTQVVNADAPAAWWKLDDTNTTATDEKQNHPGQYNNAGGRTLVAGATPFSGANQASKFESTTWATIPNTTSPLLSGEGSVEAWFQMPSQVSTAGNYMLDFGARLTVGAKKNATTGSTTLEFGGATTYSAPVSKDPFRWHHLVVTMSNSSRVFYLDGKRLAAQSEPTIPSPPSEIRLGSNGSATSSWAGSLQHVVVYGSALSTVAVTKHRAAGAGMTNASEYDPNGNVVATTDAEGFTTKFTYDALDRLVKITHPDWSPEFANFFEGAVEKFAYDDNGNLVYSVDPNGALKTFQFDDLGNSIKTTSTERIPEQQTIVENRTFDEFGDQLTATVQGSGVTTSWTYNAAGEPRSETTTGLGTRNRTYDVAGRVTFQSEPTFAGTGFKYDLAGRMVELRRPYSDGESDLQVTTYVSYDKAANPIAVTDPRGKEWTATFDAKNQLTKLSDPPVKRADGSPAPRPVTEFGYDVTGHRTRVTDGNNHSTLTTYDSHGWVDTITQPSTPGQTATSDRSWSYDYDNRGLPTQERAPGGIATTNTFDALGDLRTQTATQGSVSATKTFVYDLARRLTGMFGSEGEYDFRHDDRGNLVLVAKLISNEEYPEYANEFAAKYDSLNRPVTSWDNGSAMAYTYSGANLASETDGLSGIKHSYTYDTGGLRTAETATQAGTTVSRRSWTYDELGRQSSQEVRDASGTELGKALALRDDSGNIISQQGRGQLQNAHSDLRNTYDDAGRLVSSEDVRSSKGTDYSWDAAGNRTASTPWTGTMESKSTSGATTYSYDDRNRLLKSTAPAATTDFTYNPRGDLTTAVNTPATGSSTMVTTAYDPFGRLASDSSSSASGYEYDSLDRLTNIGGTGAVSYRGLGREPVRVGSTWSAARSGDGELLTAKNGSSAAATVISNGHRDVIATTGATTGQVVATTTYDPFGSVTGATGQTGKAGWQGSLVDTSGKTQADTRWYDTSMGRFTAQDRNPPQITTGASANLYGYGDANPTTAIDPTGQNAIWDFLTGAADKAGSAALVVGVGVKELGMATARQAPKFAGRAVIGALGDAAIPVIAGAVLIGGTYYLIDQLNDGVAPSTTITGPTSGASPITTSSPGKPKVETLRRWHDAENAYVSIRTTITTITYTTVTRPDGSTYKYQSGSNTKTTTRTQTVSLINPEVTRPVTMGGPAVLTMPLVNGAASADGVCGQGGSPASCVADPGQPTPPSIPPPPEPQPGGSGGGRSGPPRIPVSPPGFPGEDDDESDGSASSPDPDGVTVDLRTAGRSSEEVKALNEYARLTNQWLRENGPQVIRSTRGPLRTASNRLAAAERLRALRAGTPYSGQVGHVPDAAISGAAQPPMGWLDMPGVSNSIAGGALSSRVGLSLARFTVDGVVP